MKTWRLSLGPASWPTEDPPGVGNRRPRTGFSQLLPHLEFIGSLELMPVRPGPQSSVVGLFDQPGINRPSLDLNSLMLVSDTPPGVAILLAAASAGITSRRGIYDPTLYGQQLVARSNPPALVLIPHQESPLYSTRLCTHTAVPGPAFI